MNSWFDFFGNLIASGALQSGARVPSSRTLASELRLARNTVTLAYERLTSEGFLQTRSGSGTFVLERAAGSSIRQTRVPPSSNRGSERAKELVLKAPVSQPNANWPLTPTLPALDAFPHALWAKLEARFWRKQPIVELGNGDPSGYMPLRQALVGYLGAARGIACSAEQIVATSGAQSGILISALAISDVGAHAWVEHPGYEVGRRALSLAGQKIIGIPVDSSGFDIEYAMRETPCAQLALVTPCHQFPLGSVMSSP